ncbi:MAG TPA: hypothetical protein VGR37_04915 [Longimicrobiaceae bacterium]|nr:hypothetical protein [Longimicrobiaceae bacterium]
MNRLRFLVVLGACALAAPGVSHAQGWSPPSRMPDMPRMADLQGSWQGAVGGWAGQMAQVSSTSAGEIRAAGETTPGSDRAKLVRFTAGVFPVATWSDRNGDGRCDMVEIFRQGSRVYQLIDADYDGNPNVLRVYSPSGELLRDERL